MRCSRARRPARPAPLARSWLPGRARACSPDVRLARGASRGQRRDRAVSLPPGQARAQRAHRRQRRCAMQLHSCSAGGATFSLAVVDAAEPAGSTPLLAALREQPRPTSAGDAATGRAVRAAGRDAEPASALLRIVGRRRTAGRVVAQAAFFVKGLRLYQATASLTPLPTTRPRALGSINVLRRDPPASEAARQPATAHNPPPCPDSSSSPTRRSRRRSRPSPSTPFPTAPSSSPRSTCCPTSRSRRSRRRRGRCSSGCAAPELLIFTDVFGATPCNIAQRLADGVRVKVVTGVNVPMLWRTLVLLRRIARRGGRARDRRRDPGRHAGGDVATPEPDAESARP